MVRLQGQDLQAVILLERAAVVDRIQVVRRVDAVRGAPGDPLFAQAEIGLAQVEIRKSLPQPNQAVLVDLQPDREGAALAERLNALLEPGNILLLASPCVVAALSQIPAPDQFLRNQKRTLFCQVTVIKLKWHAISGEFLARTGPAKRTVKGDVFHIFIFS